MRLTSLEISGFRGFATEQTFDLNADAIIVVGANGNGKTSFFDAILWVLSGCVPRLGKSDESIVSRFSESGQARVTVTLTSGDDQHPIRVTRVYDGKETKLSVEEHGKIARGPEAEGHLINLLWRDAANASNPMEALATVLSRSVYLQQDLVRQFVESATGQERFSAISELVGAGRVTELLADLEKSKTAWSKATNTKDGELNPLRSRLSTMRSRIAEIKSREGLAGKDSIDDSSWINWRNELREFGLEIAKEPSGATESAAQIDGFLKALDGARRTLERNQQSIVNLISDWEVFSKRPRPEGGTAKAKLDDTINSIKSLKEKILAEQARISEVRRLQADLAEKSEQLRALASLALKHLGDTCPVCDQDYDHAQTKRRLDELVQQDVKPSSAQEQVTRLPELNSELSELEKTHSRCEMDVKNIEQAIRTFDSQKIAIENQLKAVGLDPTQESDLSKQLQEALSELNRKIETSKVLQTAGEKFSSAIARQGERATILELEKEAAALATKIKESEEEIGHRNDTGTIAQTVIEALRDASARVVSEQIKEIEPLLSDFYSRIDVHPAFRGVQLLASSQRGKGQLSTMLSDPLSNVQVDSPALVLSSSQLNALAVCTFLSLSLGVSRTPLGTAILDDPLQSLDDINLLGLIDLLRRAKDQKQLLVSTHDVRFGNLLSRKLRPRTSTQRTIVIDLEGWGRNGPSVITRDIEADPVPLRLSELH